MCKKTFVIEIPHKTGQLCGVDSRVASLRVSKYPSSSKQIRTCSKRHQMKASCTPCPKASLSFYLERTLLSRGFFPPFVGKNHVLCKLRQSDWSILLLAAKTKCKTLPLRHCIDYIALTWECGRSSCFVFVTERRQTKHAAHRLPGRKGCVSTDNTEYKFTISMIHPLHCQRQSLEIPQSVGGINTAL